MGNPVIDFPWPWTHVAPGAGNSLLVQTGAGVLHSIVLNGLTVAGDATVYDGIDATGSVIAVLSLTPATASVSVQSITWTYDAEISTGIFIVFDGTLSADLTVMHK